MHIRVLLVLVGIMMTVGHVVDAICPSGKPYTNGCTTVFNLPFKGRFTPACNRHDVCYSCGVKFGKSRSWCDKIFLEDMKTSCGGENKCTRWANKYHAAVRDMGSLFYKRKPKSWCDEDWVGGCI